MTNKDEYENFKSTKNGRNELILKMLRDAYLKVAGEPMAFNME